MRPLERPLGHVRREPAGVLEDEPEPERSVADGLGVERPHLQSRRDERKEEREVGVWPHLPLELRERRVEPEADDVPAAELDRAELRVLEGVPVDIALAQLVGQLDQREVVVR